MSNRDDTSLFVRNAILVEGLDTSYLEAGSGPSVVLLHAGEFGGEAETCWEATIPALAQHYRVLAPELLGFGRTAKVVENDKIKPHGWWEELTGKMSNARVVIVPEAGHCAQLEQPDVVNAALLDFLSAK